MLRKPPLLLPLKGENQPLPLFRGKARHCPEPAEGMGVNVDLLFIVA